MSYSYESNNSVTGNRGLFRTLFNSEGVRRILLDTDNAFDGIVFNNTFKLSMTAKYSNTKYGLSGIIFYT